MAELAPEVFDREWLREFMESVKELQKGYQVEHDCPECSFRKKVTVQIPDFKNILDSVTELFNQAYGRPGTDNPESQGTVIVVKRIWPEKAASGDG